MFQRRMWLALAGGIGCSGESTDGSTRVEQRWVVQGDVDILVFTDTSDSMADQLAALAGNVEILVSRLEAVESNWHLIAVTGPDGCGQGGVLTRDTPDWPALFAEGIVTKPGEDLVDEWGLYNAQEALVSSATGGCNAGFLRREAHLSILFISDEDDNSPGFDGGDPNYWQTYVDGYQATKAEPERVHLSAVGGPEPEGCNSADFARGYWEAVSATNGQFLSICGNWEYEIEALADSAVVQTSFPLAEPSTGEGIRVFVDGLERLDGWSWLEANNEVTFTARAPFAGQEVEIDYPSAY